MHDLYSTIVSVSCNPHKDVSTHLISAQLLELELRIGEVLDTIRGIVFVSTKGAASMLRARLSVTFPSLKVDTVLGQSQGTGMPPRAQRRVIELFKSGTYCYEPY